jgi:hypothetical protein
MSDKKYLQAPFTDKQVAKLRNWQRSPMVHPYTCRQRDDSHRWVEEFGDYGALLPTRRGWVCLDCDYTQDWAYDFPNPPPTLQEVFGFE